MGCARAQPTNREEDVRRLQFPSWIRLRALQARKEASRMRNRIPSLDGLRAISIAFVLAGHLGGTAGFPIPVRIVGYFGVAELGVRVFFVISGFLITGLLLDEIQKTDTISLPHFYLRRTLRIFPPYYAMLLCVGLAAAFGGLDLKPGDLLHALTYTTNYHANRAWSLGHTWSLAVEEQFYLLWPAVMLVIGPSRSTKAVLAIIIVVPFIRLVEWYAGAHALIGNSFETVADALATGCLLALARDALWHNTRYQRLLRSTWFIVVPAIPLALSGLSRPRTEFAIGITLSNLCVAATIDWCVRFHEGRIGRILNARSIAFLGTLSYSLYLWQQPFVNRTSEGAVARFPLSVLLAFGCALASYYLVERPALAFRSKLEALRGARGLTLDKAQSYSSVSAMHIYPLSEQSGARVPAEALTLEMTELADPSLDFRSPNDYTHAEKGIRNALGSP